MTPTSAAPPQVLVAEDDPDDRLLLEEAFAEARVPVRLRFADDGEHLLELLQRAVRPRAPEALPVLVLLDLNMPRLDGREALRAIRTHHRLRHLPVILLTTSSSRDDVNDCYDLGASSFITKPVSFDALVDLAAVLGRYWLGCVRLPDTPWPAARGIG